MTAVATLTTAGPDRGRTRLDQWLWFARFARSRSLAARLCAAGAVAINGTTVKKPNQTVRVDDVVVIAQGRWQRTVRVLAIGVRRGPAAEARMLYKEVTAAALRVETPDWVPLLDPEDSADWPTDWPVPPPLT